MVDVEKNNLTDKVSVQLLGTKTNENGTAPVKHSSLMKLENSPGDTNVPDGGTRAWLVMIGSFFCNGILFGVLNSYSVIHTEILENLKSIGVSEASTKAAFVGSLAMGTTFAVSPVAGILTDKIGLRRTTLIGGFLAALGMFISSFLTNQVEALYFTYGVMYALGAALTYTPSLAILNHYFHKRLAFVNGLVTAGSSVFTISMLFFIEWIIKLIGLQPMFWYLAALCACIMLCAILFKPLPARVKSKRKQSFRNILNVSIWHNKRYVTWALVIAIALFGYFVPYVHMKKFAQEKFIDSDGKLPVVSIAITSGLGRLIFGYIADLPRVNRILLQQVSFLIIGITTMCLPFCSTFIWVLICCLIMGLFDGCFITLLGPIAFDICGEDGAAQAIGFLLGFCSIPLTFGPPIAGWIYDHTGSYQLPFMLAGIPPIIGSVALFLVRCVKNPPRIDLSREPLSQPEIVRKPQEPILNGTKSPVKLASSESLDMDGNGIV